MTRVLVVEPAGNKWGSERALLDLLDALPADPLAVCMPPRRPLEPELRKRGIRVVTTFIYALHEKTRLHRAWAALGVIYACLRTRPDLIYLNQAGAFKVALVAARLLRIPMVAHLRIFEDVAYLARQRPDPRLLRGVIAISSAIEGEVSRFSELAGVPCHRVLDAYVRQPSPGADAPAVERRIACVGRVAPIKGQDVLIAALPLIQSDAGPLECIIAGDADDLFARELKARSRVAGGAVTCLWVGVIDDAVALMRTCVAVVAPSHREPLGRVLFEAWDAGAVPIAYAGSGGAAEVIAASGGGLLYEEQTGASLARAIERVVAFSDAERAALVGKGRDWVASNCDPHAYAQRISKIFSEAALRAATA